MIFSGAKIFGPCLIGENAKIAAGTLIMNKNVKENSTVYNKVEVVEKL